MHIGSEDLLAFGTLTLDGFEPRLIDGTLEESAAKLNSVIITSGAGAIFEVPAQLADFNPTEGKISLNLTSDAIAGFEIQSPSSFLLSKLRLSQVIDSNSQSFEILDVYIDMNSRCIDFLEVAKKGDSEAVPIPFSWIKSIQWQQGLVHLHQGLHLLSNKRKKSYLLASLHGNWQWPQQLRS